MVYIVWFSNITFALKNGMLYIKSPNQILSAVVKNEFSQMIKQLISDIVFKM